MLGKQSKGQSWNNCEYFDNNGSDLEQVVVVVESKEVGKQEEGKDGRFLRVAANIASLRPFGESGLLRNAVILSATV